MSEKQYIYQPKSDELKKVFGARISLPMTTGKKEIDSQVKEYAPVQIEIKNVYEAREAILGSAKARVLSLDWQNTKYGTVQYLQYLSEVFDVVLPHFLHDPRLAQPFESLDPEDNKDAGLIFGIPENEKLELEDGYVLAKFWTNVDAQVATEMRDFIIAKIPAVMIEWMEDGDMASQFIIEDVMEHFLKTSEFFRVAYIKVMRMHDAELTEDLGAEFRNEVWEEEDDDDDERYSTA